VGGKLAIVDGQAEGVPAVFHWNGKSWSRVTLPGPIHEGYFSAVSARSATDVWAIMWAIGQDQSGLQPEAVFWNGKSWKLTKVPQISLPANGEALPANGEALPTSGEALPANGEALPADFGFTAITGSNGTGGFRAVHEALDSASGTAPAEDLVRYSHGTWSVTSLPAIPGGIPGTTSLTGLANVPGTQQARAQPRTTTPPAASPML
jgi:hypothetical protein